MFCFLGHFINFCPCSTSEYVSSPEFQHALIKICKFETHISWFTGVQSIISSMWNKILEGSKQRKETLNFNQEHLLLMHIFGKEGIFEILLLQNLFWTSDKKKIKFKREISSGFASEAQKCQSNMCHCRYSYSETAVLLGYVLLGEVNCGFNLAGDNETFPFKT